MPVYLFIFTGPVGAGVRTSFIQIYGVSQRHESLTNLLSVHNYCDISLSLVEMNMVVRYYEDVCGQALWSPIRTMVIRAHFNC